MKLSLSFFDLPKNYGLECPESGLPVCQTSTKIVGRGALLKRLRHTNLQSLVDVESSNQERIAFVSEQPSQPSLAQLNGKLSEDDGLSLAKSLFSALHVLHEQGFVHGQITNSTIHFDAETKTTKLSEWFVKTLTNFGEFGGNDVTKSIKYSAPEVIISKLRKRGGAIHHSADIFSAGLVLFEVIFGIKLWKDYKDTKLLVKERLKLAKNGHTPNTATAVTQSIGCVKKFNDLHPALKKILEASTSHLPSTRPTAREILKWLDSPVDDNPQFELFSNVSNVYVPKEHTVSDVMAALDHTDAYYFWRLSSNGLNSELERSGLIQKTVGISKIGLIPSLAIDKGANGQAGNCNKQVELDMTLLESALQGVDEIAANPVTVIDIEPVKLSPALRQINEERRLPLSIRESSIIYQFHRTLMYRRLLSGYPHTRKKIFDEAKIDIPPNMRSNVWTALLGVTGDTREMYMRINKCARRETDRQIEVDIPRCHQYLEVIASPEGARKLKRVIKAWLVSNPHLTYWQGLDSLTVPFVILHYDREDLAFASMSKFIPKYMNGLFQRDNASVIQEYLAVFQQLICHHDPELANHLSDMEGQAFVPDLYAIPWFLTMFSHVFPIKKIFHLWDTLLVYDSSLPLFVGVAIMLRLKRQLMTFSFNDCILSFSDMPDIDVDDIVTHSTILHRDTPQSCAYRVHQPDFEDQGILSIHKEDVDLQERREERLPRISLADVCRLNRINSSTFIGDFTGEEFEIIDDIENLGSIERVLIVDCRAEEEYNSGTLPGAINLPLEDSFEDPTIEIPHHSLKASLSSIKLISARGNRIIVVAGKDTRSAQAFAAKLLSLGYPKLCTLHGGFDFLVSLGASLEVPELRGG